MYHKATWWKSVHFGSWLMPLQIIKSYRWNKLWFHFIIRFIYTLIDLKKGPHPIHICSNDWYIFILISKVWFDSRIKLIDPFLIDQGDLALEKLFVWSSKFTEDSLYSWILDQWSFLWTKVTLEWQMFECVYFPLASHLEQNCLCILSSELLFCNWWLVSVKS